LSQKKKEKSMLHDSSQKNISFSNNSNDDSDINNDDLNDYNQSYTSIPPTPRAGGENNQHDEDLSSSQQITNDYDDDTNYINNKQSGTNYSDIESEFDGDILDDDKWDTDIEAESKFVLFFFQYY
jgi:hypothetical protein